MNKNLFAILGLALALGAAGCGKKEARHGNGHHRDRHGVMERRDHRSHGKHGKHVKHGKHSSRKMTRDMRSEERMSK